MNSLIPFLIGLRKLGFGALMGAGISLIIQMFLSEHIPVEKWPPEVVATSGIAVGSGMQIFLSSTLPGNVLRFYSSYIFISILIGAASLINRRGNLARSMNSLRQRLINNQNYFLLREGELQDGREADDANQLERSGIANSQDIEDLIGITLDLESKVESMQIQINRFQDMESQLRDSLKLADEERARIQDTMQIIISMKSELETQKQSVDNI